MNITLIGSGNVAHILGRLLLEKNYTMTEVAARTKDKADALAQQLHSKSTHIEDINNDSDIYIIAVADKAVANVASQLKLNDKLVIHTCGSVSINVLKSCSENYGVLYPLQSIRKETAYIPDIPFLVDGSNEEVKTRLHQLAFSLSGKVEFANDDERLKYHVAAITASNFSNYLYVVCKQFCDENNVDFSLVIPLIKETANRLDEYNPAAMQTGPAVRNDVDTLQKHINLLQQQPRLQMLYKVLTNAILEHYHHPLLKDL